MGCKDYMDKWTRFYRGKGFGEGEARAKASHLPKPHE